MNWGHYIVLAKGLAGQRFEASGRSAVSRAYYGAFNVSRRWLEANVTPIDNRHAHEQVWETFKTAERAAPHSTDKWQLVGAMGDSLRVLRNRADYDDAFPGVAREAHRAIGIAELILQLLAQLEVDD
jgi:hypothetical protein